VESFYLLIRNRKLVKKKHQVEHQNIKHQNKEGYKDLLQKKNHRQDQKVKMKRVRGVENTKEKLLP